MIEKNAFKYACLVCAIVLSFIILCCAKSPQTNPELKTTLKPTSTVAPTSAPSPTPYNLALGDTGEDVLRVKNRLIELNYLDDEADTSEYDDDLKAAVELFQEWNDLPVTGIVDEKTLECLNSSSCVVYDDFYLYAPTVNMEFSELVGDNGDYDYPVGYPPSDTYKIIVDLEHQVTMVFSMDENGEYTIPVRYMLCSTGANDCTPKGTFEMDSYRVRFSKFVRDGRYGQYWTQIRRAIYFHTILYTQRDAATYQADIYRLLGTADSHGCIRLTVPDARWMWYNIAPGTICQIRDGSPDDLKTKAIRDKLTLAEPPEEPLNLKPGEIPNTDNWRIEDVPHDIPFVQGSQD